MSLATIPVSKISSSLHFAAVLPPPLLRSSIAPASVLSAPQTPPKAPDIVLMDTSTPRGVVSKSKSTDVCLYKAVAVEVAVNLRASPVVGALSGAVPGLIEYSPVGLGAPVVSVKVILGVPIPVPEAVIRLPSIGSPATLVREPAIVIAPPQTRSLDGDVMVRFGVCFSMLTVTAACERTVDELISTTFRVIP